MFWKKNKVVKEEIIKEGIGDIYIRNAISQMAEVAAIKSLLVKKGIITYGELNDQVDIEISRLDQLFAKSREEKNLNG